MLLGLGSANEYSGIWLSSAFTPNARKHFNRPRPSSPWHIPYSTNSGTVGIYLAPFSFDEADVDAVWLTNSNCLHARSKKLP
jgi:hypothetical protein